MNTTNNNSGSNAAKVFSFLQKHPSMFAITIGFDKKPAVFPVKLCFMDDAALWFAASKATQYYGMISLDGILTLCAQEDESGTSLILKGKPVFSEEKEIIQRCLDEDLVLKEKYGKQPEYLIAYSLKDMTAQWYTSVLEEPEAFTLGTPDNLLTGITIKKNNEIRDRLVKVMEQREAEKPEANEPDSLFIRKLTDGAILYFAETAKEVWPRMNIQPIERSVLYETYDEREKFVDLAKKLIGNTIIDKPEDLTYWLNSETLAGFYKEQK